MFGNYSLFMFILIQKKRKWKFFSLLGWFICDFMLFLHCIYFLEGYMKKIFALFLFFILLSCPATVSAKTYKFVAQTMSDFSSDKPAKNIKVQIVGDYDLDNGEYLLNGTVFTADISKVKKETRGKRPAYALLKLNSIQLPNNSEIKDISHLSLWVKMSAYKPIDIADKALDLGATAAGFAVENISYPINFVRGMIKPANPKDNRVVAGVKMTYEKSVFSYLSKGEPLVLPTGTKLILSIKHKPKKK